MITPYVPNKLPLEKLDWTRFIKLIGQANAELARYDGILQGIPNPRVLLSPLSTKEAVLSSKIEGTQATLQEVLKYEALPDKKAKKLDDIQEIINYRKSTQFIIDWLKKKPITLNMIREAHEILMDSVRGHDRAPGQFRRIQNWIGTPGSTIETATYVPPAPNILLESLSSFEKYIHFEEQDRLVQLAIIHAQFEIIHPFLDGNGRMGRILIPVFLFEKQLLHTPMFYMSGHLESNREEYYMRLREISQDGIWENWITFFLNAVIAQSKSNSEKAKAILDLYDQKKDRIVEVTRSKHAIKVLDALFVSPIFSTTIFIKQSGISKVTAMRLLDRLKSEKIIKTIEKSSGNAPEILIFEKLFNIIDK